MDTKLSLLKTFSRGLVAGTAKIETEQFGFAFLERLLSDGIRLEYGELTPAGLLHKYKLVNIPEHRMDAFLQAHIDKSCNVCRYFDPVANDVFCFNLDNNHKTQNTEVTAEMTMAVRALEKTLRELGCGPLIVASGRGYHVWGRLERPIANEQLAPFMLRAAVRALMVFHESGHDHQTIKFNLYPDVKIHHVVSLRLFGSEHAKNKVFSQVLSDETLLNESDSWRRFEDFIANRVITEHAFVSASKELAQSL